jgi:hypothetical protein
MRFQQAVAALAMISSCVGSAGAQNAPAGSRTYLADSASPFKASALDTVEASSVAMPNLDFAVTGDNASFDKYYVFHRADTSFAAALADITECDGYARGLQSGISYQQAPYPYTYTMPGAIGGAIGSAVAIAVFGSAEKRRARRANMRACMHFKGYQRYGLSKSSWDDFNFEEGLSNVAENKRRQYLRQQALVASSGVMQGKDLGL